VGVDAHQQGYSWTTKTKEMKDGMEATAYIRCIIVRILIKREKA
jgi:hypothetical protein